jgi:hypothetical protein
MLYFTCRLFFVLSPYVLGRRQWQTLQTSINIWILTIHYDFLCCLYFDEISDFQFFSAYVISSLPFTTFLQASIGSHFPCYAYYLERLRKFVQSLFHNFFSRNCFNFMFVIWTVLGNMKPKFELLLYSTNNSSINQHIHNVRMSLPWIFYTSSVRKRKKKQSQKFGLQIGTKFQCQKSELEKIYVSGKNTITKLICCS